MQQSDRAGLAYALAGFCTLSIGDAIVKSMAGEWPAPAIATLRYVFGTVLLLVLLVRREGWGVAALPKDKLQWVRGLSISCAAIGMFFAVWVMPLAEATTIAFTQPMITAVLAAVLLRERARPSTWIATLIAFVGVFIVLRPNFASAGWGSLFPLMGATGMAVTIIANRAVTGRASVLAMQYYMSVTAMIILLVATVATHLSGIQTFRLTWPDWTIIGRCAFMGVSATLAQMLMYMGTVKAGAGTIAPMTYGQLLMAVALGWIFFGDKPDALAMVGAAIIIGAGLYLWSTGRMKVPPKTDL
jgi:drug/metabolite transporter (DMT)-like permease